MMNIISCKKKTILQYYFEPKQVAKLEHVTNQPFFKK